MAREPLEPPIWTRPEPGARKPRWSRAEIAAAALRIADGEGFDAVSMRRVAAELGAGTMTLYHYVRGKADLVALMDDALLAELLVPPSELPAAWRPAIELIARRTRATFLRHPWALVALLGALPGPNGLRHADQSLAALRSATLSDAARLELVALVDDYVFGHCLRAGEAAAADDVPPDVAEAVRAFTEGEIARGHLPELARLGARGEDPVDRSAAALEARFERGLALLLDGAAAQMSAAS
ncbi:MAG: TetR/AcrR family transcriptional regulator C-terminal domain-containing protein [Myxococcales bacterium]|nr:TetR/AcrR family transcriptional regulator C-terminal domain-containing protein [Myxococcales bacterium]MCB9736678.1 TetR/AcrR family transcriptional regulator [Deltaproteobacteria bacterium]